MAISSYRLPDVLAKGAEFGPEFENIIQEAISGTEQRVRTWAKCRGRGDVSFGLRKVVDVTDQLNYIRQVNAMFLAHGGSLLPFRFRDPFDYSATDERFGTGDASQLSWQLIKTYDPLKLMTGTPGSITYVRDILLPASSVVIKVDGVTKTVVTDYTISNVGIVTFAVAPANAAVLTWSGDFEIPVRFDMKGMPVRMESGRHGMIGSIPIREVLGSAEITS
jgi:uncharacterized protein (TIGR02217 family)